jgi:beta-xylosidase
MPNAHWSDPSVVRHGNTYYVVTSSIETTPSLQILRSTDLVNYDVVGSVSRHWFTHTVDGDPLLKRQCWSPRLMFVAGKFRVMWHQAGHFMVAESLEPQGPWSLVHHNLTGMAQPTPQWAATTFVDTDGKTYIFAFNWIRETDAAALNWIGPQHLVADMHDVGVGLMENPSLMKRGVYYYWHESVNGTVTWGLAPDPNAGPKSSNKGALAVWRSKKVTGPFEGPRIMFKSNVMAACVNTGTVVLGPDNTTWYYLYDAIVPSRWNMQRQMFVDRISWGEDNWPVPRTPGGRNKFPKGGLSPKVADRWQPDLNDNFDGKTLEGVSGGVLGRKWLFKQENETLWEMTSGALSLRTDCTGIESDYPANMLLQRPTGAYYSLETKLRWPVATTSASRGGVGCSSPGSAAGLIARELSTGQGIAIGLVCNKTTGNLAIAAWQNSLDLLHAIPFPTTNSTNSAKSTKSTNSATAYHEIRLRVDIELVLAQVWYSVAGGPWTALPPFNDTTHGSEMTFEYVSTLMWWQAVGPDRAAWEHVFKKPPSDAFTTLHPGLFAGGGTGRPHSVLFDYFRFQDNEEYPTDEV